MGRPPCCDKSGVKKGPWTPEEDIMLVSYVQEHGPGNWRAVPTNTGLRRCSKSCRLRWTNYLRPGIKRGSFTDHEEKMIIQLQALLGNKWAAIASYLPERTDNDIKNYWNTHLKKKLKKLQTGCGGGGESRREGLLLSSSSTSSSSSSLSMCRGQWEKRLQTDINMAKQALHEALSNLDSSSSSLPLPTTTSFSTYASSTENIAKFLKNWTKDYSPPDNIKHPQPQTDSSSTNTDQYSFNNNNTTSSDHLHANGVDLSEAFESLFGFEYSLDKSNNSDTSRSSMSPEVSLFQGDSKRADLGDQVLPLSILENWLFDESVSAENADLF